MDKTSNKNNILLSNSAIDQFKKILLNEDKNSFVRLLVDSGGCSGFSYKFSVDKVIDDLNDIIILEEESKKEPLNHSGVVDISKKLNNMNMKNNYQNMRNNYF